MGSSGSGVSAPEARSYHTGAPLLPHKSRRPDDCNFIVLTTRMREEAKSFAVITPRHPRHDSFHRHLRLEPLGRLHTKAAVLPYRWNCLETAMRQISIVKVKVPVLRTAQSISRGCEHAY